MSVVVVHFELSAFAYFSKAVAFLSELLNHRVFVLALLCGLSLEDDCQTSYDSDDPRNDLRRYAKGEKWPVDYDGQAHPSGFLAQCFEYLTTELCSCLCHLCLMPHQFCECRGLC